jgi:hypothetical protein
VYARVTVWLCPDESLIDAVHVPALGELATVAVNEFPLCAIVPMFAQPLLAVAVSDLLKGAFVQPASEAVNVALEPVPLTAYRSTPAKFGLSESLVVTTIGWSVGANEVFTPVNPVALAAIVAGAMARPL